MQPTPSTPPDSDSTLLLLSVPGSGAVRIRSLPPAEREVAEAVLRGLSNAEIARQRGTSLKTVANQLARLFERFDVHSRAALVRELERPATDGR